MSNIAADQVEPALEPVMRLIKELPNEMRQRLRLLLDEDIKAEPLHPLDSKAPPIIPPKEFARKWELERKWLEENGQEYAGRWVALDGVRLLATGSSASEVYAALKATGVSGSLVMRVEHPDNLSVIE